MIRTARRPIPARPPVRLKRVPGATVKTESQRGREHNAARAARQGALASIVRRGRALNALTVSDLAVASGVTAIEVTRMLRAEWVAAAVAERVLGALRREQGACLDRSTPGPATG